MRGHRFYRVVWAAAVTGAVSAIAPAQVARQPDAEAEVAAPELDERAFDRLVRDLDSPDLTTRELASERLGMLPGLTLDHVLERLVDRDELGPEQARRLERIAGRLFQSAPKAGLGVQFGRQNAARGVQIEATVDPARFPAASILEPGDYIAEVRGRAVRSPDDLRAAILSHLPGETMPTVVIRNEERLELELPLGNFDMLGRTERIDAEMARRCVLARLDRLAGARLERAALGEDISAGAWAQAGDDAERRFARRAGTPRGLGAKVGGTPRIDPTGAEAGTPLAELVEHLDTGAFDPRAMSPEQRLEWYLALQQTFNSLGSQIRTTRLLLDDPSNTSAEAELLEDRVRELVIEQRRIGDQLTALEELGLNP
ncbi:MAG: PDZ domain-containing protein [Phycisphaerales bacterium]